MNVLELFNFIQGDTGELGELEVILVRLFDRLRIRLHSPRQVGAELDSYQRRSQPVSRKADAEKRTEDLRSFVCSGNPIRSVRSVRSRLVVNVPFGEHDLRRVSSKGEQKREYGFPRILASPDTSSVRKSSQLPSQPFPNLFLKLPQPLPSPDFSCNSFAKPFPRRPTSSSIPRPSFTPKKKDAEVLAFTPSLVVFWLQNHHLPTSGQAEAKYECVEHQDPNVVLALDELDRDGNYLVAAIGVTVLFVVSTNGQVCKPKRRHVNKGDVAEQ